MIRMLTFDSDQTVFIRLVTTSGVAFTFRKIEVRHVEVIFE